MKKKKKKKIKKKSKEPSSHHIRPCLGPEEVAMQLGHA